MANFPPIPLFGCTLPFLRDLFHLHEEESYFKTVLLVGPSGSGKTSLVYELAQLLGVQVRPIDGLLHQIPTESETEEIFLYDNTEYWIGSTHNKDEVQTARAVLLLKMMIHSPGHLIVTCTSEQNLPSLLLSKFDDIIHLDFPDIERRTVILHHYIRQYNSPLLDEDIFSSKIRSIAENTFGFLPCDLRSLCNVIIEDLEAQKEKENIWDINERFMEPRKIIRCATIPSYSLDPIPNIYWNDIGGLETVKTKLKENIVWVFHQKEAFIRLGIEPVKGILLHGPPGTGKTLLAKAIATEVNANFINTKISSILNAYVGESERILCQLFETAKSVAPAVIFFDEIDALFGQREENAPQATQMIISQLLLEMDNISEEHPIMIVAATNCPEQIDESFVQAGRFDQIIYVPPPDYWGRKQILEIFAAKLVHSPHIHWDSIIEKTDGFTGADLRNLCNVAGQMAIARQLDAAHIDQEDFDNAVHSIITSKENK